MWKRLPREQPKQGRLACTNLRTSPDDRCPSVSNSESEATHLERQQGGDVAHMRRAGHAANRDRSTPDIAEACGMEPAREGERRLRRIGQGDAAAVALPN